jgi:hypothetical protein
VHRLFPKRATAPDATNVVLKLDAFPREEASEEDQKSRFKKSPYQTHVYL